MEPILWAASAAVLTARPRGRPKSANAKCAKCTRERKRCTHVGPNWPGHEQSTGAALLDVGMSSAGDSAAPLHASPAGVEVGTPAHGTATATPMLMTAVASSSSDADTAKATVQPGASSERSTPRHVTFDTPGGDTPGGEAVAEAMATHADGTAQQRKSKRPAGGRAAQRADALCDVRRRLPAPRERREADAMRPTRSVA